MSKTASELIQDAINEIEGVRGRMPLLPVDWRTIAMMKKIDNAVKILHKTKAKIIESNGFPRVER